MIFRQSSQLARRMLEDSNKEERRKIKELQEFIARFSATFLSQNKQQVERKC